MNNMVLELPKKNEAYKKSKNDKNNKVDLGNFTFEWDNDYCGAFFQGSKQIPKPVLKARNPGDRYFWFKDVSPAPKVCDA